MARNKAGLIAWWFTLLTLQADAFTPVATGAGGYASVNTTNLPTFTARNSGFVGAFLGFEHRLPWSGQWSNYFFQVGGEYDYFGAITYPEDNYRFQSQQVLAVAKGIGSYRQLFNPYVLIGLGAAFNRLAALNAPVLTRNPFSYALGIGVEKALLDPLLLGLGYRYSNFGSSTVTSAAIATDAAHAYANQFVAQITYKLL